MAWIRDLAIILLAIEAFIVALVPLLIVGGLVYGMWWLLRRENLPAWLKMAQAYLDLACAYVKLAMAHVIRPFIWIQTTLATAHAWLETLTQFAKDFGRRDVRHRTSDVRRRT
ncbi:MAG TPA: hypothetical protein ENN19_15610 [Chloroflexi bacterium]|nr:hypothetical protein [Chloroflexota bacterium]